MIGSLPSMSHDLLSTLREQMRRIERPTATAHGVAPFGVAAIDRALPGGGLARGALHEILGAGGDEEDGALAAAFAASIVARLGTAAACSHRHPGAGGAPTSPSHHDAMGPFLSPLKGGEGKEARRFSLSAPRGGEGWGEVGAAAPSAYGIVLWCLARTDLYGAGLAAHGLDPARLALVRATRDADLLWAMEEGLCTSGVAAVVGEVGSLPAVASRRLQLAAERRGVTAFVLRRWRNGGQAARERNLANAAATRWRISALPSQSISIPSFARECSSPFIVRHLRESGDPGAAGKTLAALGPRWSLSSGRPLAGPVGGGDDNRTEPGIGHPRWRVELLRCRGGEPACWEVEVREGRVANATDTVSLAEALADRPAASVGGNASPPERARSAG